MSKTLKIAVRSASAKTFAMWLMWPDAVMALAVTVFLGCVAFRQTHEIGLARVGAVALSSIGALVSLFLLRALAPFVLRVSFGDCMRLQLPFRLWTALLVCLVGVSSPVTRLFTVFDWNSVQVVLMLASLACAVRFFASGGVAWRIAAFVCAGAATGISAIGLVLTIVLFVLIRLMSRTVMSLFEYEWRDRLMKGVMDYYSDALIVSRMKIVHQFGFLIGAGAVVLCAGYLNQPWTFADGKSVWLEGVNPVGVAVFVALAVLPAFLALCRIGEATDLLEKRSFGQMAIYYLIGPVCALVLLCPEVLGRLLEMNLAVDDRLMVLVLVSCAYTLLLSVLVLLVDICCRNREVKNLRKLKEIRLQMRFGFVMMTVIPFALLMWTACRVWQARPLAPQSDVEEEQTTGIELSLSPDEAMRVALDRLDHALAEKFARKVLVERPTDLLANRVLGEMCLNDGNVRAATIYANRILPDAQSDVDALKFILRVFEAGRNTRRADEVRARLRSL